MNSLESRAISVSDLNNQIKNILEKNISRFWVSGEISNFIHHTSGHMYFTLKDQKSEIRCVMFKGPNQSLQFKPENGMQVLLDGEKFKLQAVLYTSLYIAFHLFCNKQKWKKISFLCVNVDISISYGAV